MRLPNPLCTAILALTVACAADDLPDESSVEPPPNAEPPLPVEVVLADHIDFDTEPMVIVHGADGSFVSHRLADADGFARLDDVPSGGSVTYALQGSGDRLLFTFVDVSPGDTIAIGASIAYSDAEMTVTFDASEVLGAVRVSAGAGCSRRAFGLEAVSEPVFVSDDCTRETATATAIAYDDDDQPVAYAALPGVSLVDGADVVFDDWRTDFAHVDVLLDNNTPTLGQLALATSTESPDGWVDTWYEDAEVAPGGVALFSSPIVPVGVRRVHGFVELAQSQGERKRQSTIAWSEVPGPGEVRAYEVDLAEALLPVVTNIRAEPNGLSAEFEGACALGGEPDVTTWNRVADGPDRRSWTVVADGATRHVSFPDLGPVEEEWWPETTEAPLGRVVAVADAGADFEALRGSVAVEPWSFAGRVDDLRSRCLSASACHGASCIE